MSGFILTAFRSKWRFLVLLLVLLFLLALPGVWMNNQSLGVLFGVFGISGFFLGTTAGLLVSRRRAQRSSVVGSGST